MYKIEQCTNKIGFSMPSDQIIFYKDPDTGSIYCFDIKEIYSIIKSGVNPFTSKKISKEFISELVLKHKDTINQGLNKLAEKSKYFGKLKSFVDKNKETISSVIDVASSIKK